VLCAIRRTQYQTAKLKQVNMSKSDKLIQKEQLSENIYVRLTYHEWIHAGQSRSSVLFELQDDNNKSSQRINELKWHDNPYGKSTIFKTTGPDSSPGERLVYLTTDYDSKKKKDYIEVKTYFIGNYQNSDPDKKYRSYLKPDDNNTTKIYLKAPYVSTGRQNELFSSISKKRLYFSGVSDDQIGSVSFFPIKDDLKMIESKKGICDMKTVYGPLSEGPSSERLVLAWNGWESYNTYKVAILEMSEAGEKISSEEINFPEGTLNKDIVIWEGVDGEFNSEDANEWGIRAAIRRDHTLDYYLIKDKEPILYHNGSKVINPIFSLHCFYSIKSEYENNVPKLLQQNITFIDQYLSDSSNKNTWIKGFSAKLSSSPSPELVAEENSQACTVLGYILGTPPGKWGESTSDASKITISTSNSKSDSFSVANSYDLSGTLSYKKASVESGFTASRENKDIKHIETDSTDTLCAKQYDFPELKNPWDIGWVYLITPRLICNIFDVKCFKNGNETSILFQNELHDDLTIFYTYANEFNPHEFVPFQLSNTDNILSKKYSNFITKNLPNTCPTNDIDGWYELGEDDKTNPEIWWDTMKNMVHTLGQNDKPRVNFSGRIYHTDSLSTDETKIKTREHKLNLKFGLPGFGFKINHNGSTSVSIDNGLKITFVSDPLVEVEDFTEVWLFIPDSSKTIDMGEIPWKSAYMAEYDTAPWIIHYKKYK